MYTYHKYQKSMQTNIALDAHGNPLPQEEELIDGDVALENGDYSERERLTSNVDDEDGSREDDEGRRTDRVRAFSLFVLQVGDH